MPFIHMGENLDDLQEDQPVPEGVYDLMIVTKGDMKKSESGRTMIPLGIRIEDPDYPDAALVWHNLVFPLDDEPEPRTKKLLLLNIKRFLACFNISWGEEGFDDEELDGAKGKCALVQSEWQGQPRNELRLPKTD